MPLASWATLHFYGPAAGAAVVAGQASTTAGLVADAALAGASAGVGAIVDADATRLVGQGGASAGVASAVTEILARARLNASLSIGFRPSATDIAGELLDVQQVEDGLSLRAALRIVTAALAGKVSGAAGTTVTIRDVNDTRDRIVATVDASGNRSAVTLDGAG